MTDTINTMWRSFAEAVIPAGAPHVQVREMRRAFFAGAHALFHLIDKAADLDDERAGHVALRVAAGVAARAEKPAGKATTKRSRARARDLFAATTEGAS